MNISDITPVHLVLLWPAEVVDPPLQRIRDLLTRRVGPAVLASPAATPVGKRCDLAVATHDGAVVPDGAGEAAAAVSPESLSVTELEDLLRRESGAWVLRAEPGASPRSLEEHLEAHEPALARAVAEARAQGSSAPLEPIVVAEVHQGEADPDRYAALAVPGGIRLHQDLGIFSPVASAAGAAEAVVLNPSDPRASLTLSDRGGWCRLSWYSALTMTRALEDARLRQPDLVLDVGRGMEAFPGWELTEDELALNVTLTQAVGAPTFASQSALESDMSQVRAEQALASLMHCATAPGSESALSKQPWLDHLRDAVEMLGFETRLVDLIADHAQTPADAVEVGETDTVTAEPETTDWAEQPTADAAVASAPGQPSAGGARNWLYATVVVQMLIGAIFIFIKPLPWSWANLLVATLAIASGVIMLARGERRPRA
ncbi:hypothetical protein [Galactobacter sp.]|uniref:hypothetical protein n=1 Tax=Galactobacter sp. TaxID=2676125 RepID=UPI0025C574D0|nr:hypothetical protein [Galactobacter sp.]